MEGSSKICGRCQVRYFQKYNYTELRNVEEVTKKDKCACIACLNILDEEFINKCVKIITEEANIYAFTSFKITVLQPVQLIVCNKIAIHQLMKTTSKTEKEFQNYLEVKDAFKVIAEPLLEKQLNSECLFEASLEIHVVLKHEMTEINLLNDLEMASPKSFKHAKFQLEKQSRKRKRDDLSYFTISSVSDAISNLNDDELLKMLKTEYLEACCEIDKVVLTHQPLLIAGRYNKYSRTLSQTPWIIDGVRKSEMSVEEHITGPLLKLYIAYNCNFSSSGREDCDVKMLGNGRPFIIEILNPKNYLTDLEAVKNVQKEINLSTKDVQVRDLQIITKSDVKMLKEGEETKTKTYSAYCIVKLQEKPENLEIKSNEIQKKLLELSNTKNLKIFQKTPLRVLHRRSLSVRPRMIEKMDIEIIDMSDLYKKQDTIFFKLTLTSQAGTYIKEFVHGDFGRTVPSLCTLLDSDVDIVNLDVDSVNLDWPIKQ